jgi:hypothetical protein
MPAPMPGIARMFKCRITPGSFSIGKMVCPSGFCILGAILASSCVELDRSTNFRSSGVAI